MQITATDAARRFSALLDSVLTGEVVTIVRNGRAVAEIRKPDQGKNPPPEADMKQAGESPVVVTSDR